MAQHTYSDDLVGDLHKDARGFRPGVEFWETWRLSTPDQRQAMWDDLTREMRESEQRDRSSQERAAAGFEKTVVQIVHIAPELSRDDVVRCLHRIYDTDGDLGYLEYKIGLPHGYIRGKDA